MYREHEHELYIGKRDNSALGQTILPERLVTGLACRRHSLDVSRLYARKIAKRTKQKEKELIRNPTMETFPADCRMERDTKELREEGMTIDTRMIWL